MSGTERGAEANKLQRHPEESGKPTGFDQLALGLEVASQHLAANIDAKDHLQRRPAGRRRLLDRGNVGQQAAAMADLTGNLHEVAGQHSRQRVGRLGSCRHQPFGQVCQTGRFGQSHVTGQPESQQPRQVVSNRCRFLGMPAEIANKRGPAGDRKELCQQKSFDVRLGNGQPGQQVGDCFERIIRKRCDQLPEPTDPKVVEPTAQLGPLPPRLVERQAQPGTQPAGLPSVEVAGTVPGDVRDDVACPAGTVAFVDQFRHGSVAAFGPDRCRLVIEEGPTVFHREAGEPFGMLLPALGQGGVEVGRDDRPGAQSLLKPFRCRQNVTDTNIGEQLASDQKRPVGEAKKRVDRHVVSQWPEWRNDSPDGGEMRR